MNSFKVTKNSEDTPKLLISGNLPWITSHTYKAQHVPFKRKAFTSRIGAETITFFILEQAGQSPGTLHGRSLERRVIKELPNSGRAGTRRRLSSRLACFRSNVCTVIANGCISDPQPARHVSTRGAYLLSRNWFTSNLAVSIIRNNIFFFIIPTALFSPRWGGGWCGENEAREKQRGRRVWRRERKGWIGGERGDKVAAAHAFVNVCRCRHPPTYANHLI